MAIDIKNYIIEKIKKQDPEVDVRPGSAIYDFLINPLTSVLEPYHTEHQAIIDRQTLKDLSALSTDELDAVCANYLVERNAGNRAQGYVKMFFREARSINLNKGTVFTDESGLLEFETVTPFTITKLQMSRNVTDYPNYDTGNIFVQAKKAGSDYNMQANSVTKLKSSNVTPLKIANAEAFILGEDQETNSALYERLKDSVYNTSLSSAEGIRTTCFNQKNSIVDVEVVGAGHPLMIRDLTNLTEDVENFHEEDFWLCFSGQWNQDSYYKKHKAFTGIFLDIDESADVAIPAPSQFSREFSNDMYEGIFFENDDFYYAQDDQKIILREYFQSYAHPDLQIDLATVLTSGVWNVHDGKNPTQIVWYPDEVQVENNRLRMGKYIDPAEADTFQTQLSAVQQIHDLLGSLLVGTTDEAYAQLGDLINPVNYNNLAPVFHKRVDQHLGVQIDVQMQTTDTSPMGQMAYITTMRNKDYYSPHDGYGLAWRKQPQAWINIHKGAEFTSEEDRLLFFEHTGLDATNYYGTLGDVSNKNIWKYNVYLVDNDLLSEDFWVGHDQLTDQTSGKNQFLQASKVWIEPNKSYEFRLKIFSKMATEAWIFETNNPTIGDDGTSFSQELKVIDRGQTYPEYIPQAAGTHFGVGVLNTFNSEWYVDNIEMKSFEESFPMHLFRFKLPPDKFPASGGFRTKYYGVGWDPIQYAIDGNTGNSKVKASVYNYKTSSWESIGNHTATIDNARYLQEIKASKTPVADYTDNEGYVNVAATAANSGPSFNENYEHSLRSYYCSIDNLTVKGVHRGNAVDIYVQDPSSIIDGQVTFTALGNVVYTGGIPNIGNFIQEFKSIRDSITDEEIDPSLYNITALEAGKCYSNLANYKIEFDVDDIAGAELKIYYRYWSYGEALNSYVTTSSQRFPASDMLIKVMPPAVIYITKLQYSGGLGTDNMRIKLSEYFNNLTETAFEKSDLVNVLYENGATYVNLDMEITVSRYSTTYEKFTTVLADTDQRYTVPTNTLCRFFTTPEELSGVLRV